MNDPLETNKNLISIPKPGPGVGRWEWRNWNDVRFELLCQEASALKKDAEMNDAEKTSIVQEAIEREKKHNAE